jgi:hypothetical protein
VQNYGDVQELPGMFNLTGINERERELINEINRDFLMEHTRAIAQWERLSGSEEELKAFRYIQKALGEYGYVTSLQKIEALISLPKSASLNISGLGEINCITQSMGASVNHLSGDLVYCGLGRPEDYKGVDIRNKIALVEGIAMPGKVKAGEDAGAIAQIHISGEYLHEMCISTVWGSPTPEGAPFLPRTPSITIQSSDGERIKRLLDGPIRAEITTVVETRYRLIPILTADLIGSEDNDLFVLFSGHVDSWYFGAMDNGSANAAQLEIARLLSKYGPHRRTLRLAFWSGHSHGRYAGSTWYADNHWEDLFDHCVAHVNIDSVGARDASVLKHAYAMQELRPLARMIIGDLAGQEFIGSRVGRAGDHSFVGIGVPAMFMSLSEQPPPAVDTPTSQAFALLAGSKKTGGLGWWWHTPYDTVDKIDPDFLVRDTSVYLAVIHRLLNEPVIPLDFRLSVVEIKQLLQDYQAAADAHLDLGLALARVEELKTELDRLYHRIERLKDGERSFSLNKLNRGLLRLSRIMTALNYVEEGRFEHDPAFGQPPLPLLGPIYDLVDEDPSSDAFHRNITALVRRRNAVSFALREAIEVVQAILADLEAKD